MSRTIVVTLDETEFTIPRLNLDQLERCGIAASELPQSRSGFAILKIALERATPKQVDPADFSPTPEQIGEAILKVMQLSGMKMGGNTGANPPVGEAPPAV